MRVTIHDMNTDPVTTYTVSSPEECRDATDESAAQLAFETGQAITIGRVIAQPINQNTDTDQTVGGE